MPHWQENEVPNILSYDDNTDILGSSFLMMILYLNPFYIIMLYLTTSLGIFMKTILFLKKTMSIVIINK